jgi:hypothetical protein
LKKQLLLLAVLTTGCAGVTKHCDDLGCVKLTQQTMDGGGVAYGQIIFDNGGNLRESQLVAAPGLLPAVIQGGAIIGAASLIRPDSISNANQQSQGQGQSSVNNNNNSDAIINPPVWPRGR